MHPAHKNITTTTKNQMIKDQMDKKFGAPWHVVVGRGFAYEVTYEVRAWF